MRAMSSSRSISSGLRGRGGTGRPGTATGGAPRGMFTRVEQYTHVTTAL
jgi:hypothetical protein